MNWLIVSGCVVLTISGIIAFLGLQLPKDHVVSRTRRFNASVDSVWDLVSDVTGAAAWRSDLKSVAPVNLNRWREVNAQGQAVLYERVEAQAPWRLVTRIADTDLPYSGTWTFELSEDGKKTTWLTITENGAVHNPIFRFMSRYIFSQTKSMETYLDSLEKKLG